MNGQDGDVGAQLEQAAALHASGRLPAAEVIYRRLLAADPANADAWHLLGVLAYQQGDMVAARERIDRAITLNPRAAPFHANRAIVLNAAGDPAGAAAACREAIALDPGVAEVWNTLAVALRDRGDPEAAKSALERALAMAPDSADAHNNLGTVFEALDRPDRAESCFRESLRLDPDGAPALDNLGRLLGRRDETLPEAISLFHRAIAAAPDWDSPQLGLGRALVRFGALRDAEARFRAITVARPRLAAGWIALGETQRERGHLAAAGESFAQAVAVAPGDATAHFLCGTALDHVGRQAEAEAAYRRALELRPGMAAAWQQLTSCRRFGDADLATVGELESCLSGFGAKDGRSRLHFALGKAYDDLGRYDEAFAHYRAGNDIEKRGLAYSAVQQDAYVAALAKVFSAEFLAAHRDCGSDQTRPVFIVGMPRSGTTMTEQLVSAHPDVHGAGELRAMPELARRIGPLLGCGEPFPASAAAITAAVAERLRREYLAALDEYSTDAPRVTDKLPANFLMLGLIALLFPRARIVHCRRDPLDTCLSIYFQVFATRHPYAHDLGNIGHHYAAYRRLMAHWRRVLPAASFYELDYERLVGDIAGEGRALFDFLGLAWDPKYAAFHENPRAVRTASKWQVRQPVYQSSRQRWRHYAGHLGPLLESLRRGGVSGLPESA